MSLKSELICNICKLILKDPITLPCSSVICGEHLKDDTVKNGKITCLKCEAEFEMPKQGFDANKMCSIILENEFHLSEEEKTIKHAIQDLIQKLEKLQEDLKRKHSDLEQSYFHHFSEIRRKIDLHREEIKAKIDEIALKMIDQVNQQEKVYTLKIKESQFVQTEVDVQQNRQIVTDEFRKFDLLIENVERLRDENEQTVNEFETRIKGIDSLTDEIKLLEFKASEGFQEASFGFLKSYKSQIACTLDKMIRIWNLMSKECVATLEGHTNIVLCLEKIDENRFASGSMDKTIKIWDANNFACLKTLTDHQDEVRTIKSLTSKRMASGSWREIRIWDTESGICIKTLIGHSSYVYDFVYMPNGQLVSCSTDKTIKVWDLDKGSCVNTITGHSGGVLYLLLLKNEQLASGSQDGTIKIWNIDSGECVKTLKEHSYSVRRLQELKNGALISCSLDKTIKIWNLSEGYCVKTLVGHTDQVKAIKVIPDHTLLSCSHDGSIKIWNLITGECVNTIVDPKGIHLNNLMFF